MVLLEHNEAPQYGAVVPAADRVLKNQPPNDTRIRILTQLCRRVAERVNAMGAKSTRSQSNSGTLAEVVPQI